MASSPPTALISWAHDADQGVENDRWLNEVLQLAVNLRHLGVHADLDLFHYAEPGIVWNQWGPRRIQECDYTLAVVNRAWSERFEGANRPDRGAGAAAEANTLLGLFDKNQHDFQRRLLVVVLPGATKDDIPARLMGQQRFSLRDFTLASMTPLLRLLHGREEFVMPPIGTVPDLPPHQVSAMDEALGTPQRHTPVPGVAEAGQDVVQQQLAQNANGDAVRLLLSTFTDRQGAQVRGKKLRSSSAGSGDDFTGYLRLTQSGKTVGYLYADTGRLNPKVPASRLDEALSLSPAARRIKSSNPSYQVSLTVVDEGTVQQALALMSRVAD